MSDLRDLESRVTTLEAAVSQSRGRFTWVLVALLGLIGAALVLCQFWLMQRQWESLRSTARERLFWTICQPSASVAERTAAFRQLVADGHSEWRSAACHGLQLRESRLDGANLQLADLTACDLRDVSLKEADLSGVLLRTADLSGADLSGAILDGAECLKAILEDAEFHKARMLNCSLEQTQAKGAKFILADLSESLLLMADLTDADFTGANLTAATLESATLRGATLSLTNLTDANLINADLTDSNWWRARGLSQDQLIAFAAEFPPSPTADPSRVNDFRLWAESFSDTSPAPANSSARRPVD